MVNSPTLRHETGVERGLDLKILATTAAVMKTLSTEPQYTTNAPAWEFHTPEYQTAISTPRVTSHLALTKTQRPVRKPKHGEVVVRIAWTGLCASDIYFSTGICPTYCEEDHVAGHEGIGHIVESHEPSQIGQPVALRFLAYACGSCYSCVQNIPESCQEKLCFAEHVNGSFQQYATAPYKTLMPLPDYVFSGARSPAVYTAALCSGSAAMKSLRCANIQPNDVVCILGIGGQIGYIAGLLAKNVFGARVIGVDIPAKAQWAQQSGACDRFFASPNQNGQPISTDFEILLATTCAELRGMKDAAFACDSVLVAAGAPECFDGLPLFVRDGGEILLVGVTRAKLSIDIATILERQLTIRGTLMGDKSESYRVMQYIKSGQISPAITSIAFETIPQYVGNFEKNQNFGKVVAEVNGPLFP